MVKRRDTHSEMFSVIVFDTVLAYFNHFLTNLIEAELLYKPVQSQSCVSFTDTFAILILHYKIILTKLGGCFYLLTQGQTMYPRLQILV